MLALRAVLKAIKKDLKEKEKVRENAQNDMRRVTSLSKQAILLAHQKRMKEAGKLINTAKEKISKLNVTSATYPEMVFTGMFNAARQEYTEASIFLNLIEEKKLVTPEEIDVPSIDYVLGLADVIGEYRRLALDALREGDLKKGEECLRMMDGIYVELMAMDETYMLVSGLRRKCDVARKIIEITRGDITQETCRSMLEQHLKRFEKRLVKKV